MTESREVLIDAMARALCDVQKYPTGPHDVDRCVVRYLLDALLAHPGAVLRELESAKCETCRGVGERMVEALDPRKMDPYTIESVGPCDACGGSGRLGRDGVLRALGMEQVGYFDEAGQFHRYLAKLDWHVGHPPVFARVPVPELSEGEK